MGMKKPNCRIIPIRDNLHSDLAFEHGVGIIQYRIDRVRGISIRAYFVSARRARADLMPVVGNWAASEPFHFSGSDCHAVK